MESAVQFISENSQTSILVIILVMMALTISWILLNFVGGRQSESTGSEINLEALREMKSELRSRELEIDQLKQQVARQGHTEESSSGEEAEAVSNHPEAEAINGDLLSKISDLEDRLAEYEIIEDDIADLSRFKEENEQLKLKIQELMKDASTSEQESAPQVEAEEKQQQPSPEDEEPELDVEMMAQKASKIQGSERKSSEESS